MAQSSFLLNTLSSPTVYTFDNELMPETNYKRPGEAFESSDDLIEDYDTFDFKPKCVEKLSILEKFLFVVLAIFFIIILALAVALGNANRAAKWAVEKHCSNPACVQAAGSLISSLNESTLPCVDFYEYACGGWVAETPIPKGHLYWDRFQELADRTYYNLERILIEDGEVLPEAAENKARKFYQSCANTVNVTTESFIASFQKLVSSVNGWTLGDNTTLNVTSWNFQETLQAIHKYGVYPLFTAIVDIDEESPDNNIFKIDPGSLGINSRFYTSLINDTDAKTQLNEYTEYIMRVGRTLGGGDQKILLQKVNGIVEFERRLAQMLPTFKKTKDRTKMYHKIDLMTLQTRAGLINWKSYLNSITFGVNSRQYVDSDKVVLYAPNYIHNLTDLVQEYSSNETKKEVLRNYLVWSLISTLEKYTGSEIFEKFRTNDVGNWKRCIFYTNKAFKFATGAIYLNRTFHEDYVAEVATLVKYIKNAFKNHLLKKYWIDARTEKIAAEKIDAIIDKISYSAIVQNSTFLDSYYQNFEVNETNWFESVLKWKTFDVKMMARRLQEKPNRESWISAPVNINTFYSPERNDLFFPAAVFQPPFFSPGRPQALNFGALGSIIGHEITHAFDILGRQFDKVGRLGLWWGNDTTRSYEITTECMVKQYEQFHYGSHRVDGTFTLEENIADNGGLRAALMGYQLWKVHHEETLYLPGTNLTHDQLFFASYAQMYCAKYSTRGIFLSLTSDTHSPNPARVMGPLKNSERFTKIYNCGLRAPMNANVRCEVW